MLLNQKNSLEFERWMQCNQHKISDLSAKNVHLELFCKCILNNPDTVVIPEIDSLALRVFFPIIEKINKEHDLYCKEISSILNDHCCIHIHYWDVNVCSIISQYICMVYFP